MGLTMTMTDSAFLRAFLDATLPEADFDHESHVRAAFLLLQEQGLAHAIPMYCDALKALTRLYGKPQKYHETITIASLAIINARRLAMPARSWSGFRRHNPDLFSGDFLRPHYTRAELATAMARRAFLLPRRGSGPDRACA